LKVGIVGLGSYTPEKIVTNFDMEKVVVTIDKHGNSSAASIPIALAEIKRNGKLKRDDKILMVSFSVGMTSGAIFME
jgi:3-oxoacyl-[acyl-carrier-protein] synthase-3